MKKLIYALSCFLFLSTEMFAGATSVPVASGASATTINSYLTTAVGAGNTDITLQFAKGGTWGTSASNGDITIAVPAGVTKLTLTYNPATSGATPVLYLNTLTYAGAISGGLTIDGLKVMTGTINRYLINSASNTNFPATVTIQNSWIEGHRGVIVLSTYTNTLGVTITNSTIKSIANNGIISTGSGVASTLTTVSITNNTFINCNAAASCYFIDYRSPNAANTYFDFSNNTVYYSSGQLGNGFFRLYNVTSVTAGHYTFNNNIFASGTSGTTFVFDYNGAGTTNLSGTGNYFSSNLGTAVTRPDGMTFTKYSENSPSTLFVNPASYNFTINDPNFAGKTSAGNSNCYYPATINVTGGTIVNLDYNVSTGPSAAKTFTFNAYALRSAVVLQAPVNFEISTDDITYKDNSQTISLGSTGDLSSQTIYVRLKAGLAVSVSPYSGVVSLTTTGTSGSASVSGNVNNPLPPLDKPTNLSTSGASYTGFQANWGAVTGTGLASYTIRLISNGSTVSTVNGVDKNSTSYTFSSLTPGTTYTFAVTAVGDGVNNNSSVESDPSSSVSLPYIYLFTSVSDASAGTVAKSPNTATYSPNTSVTLTATRNFGYSFVNWIDSVSGSTISASNPYTFSINETKHIKAVFNTINTFTFVVNISGSQWGQVSLSPAATGGKYEEGTSVTMSVVPNAVTTFTNWENASTSTSRTITVDGNKEFIAYFDESSFITGWDFRVAEPKTARTGDYYASASNKGTISLYEQAGTAVSWLSHTGWNSPSTPCAIKWTTGANFATNQRYFQASFKTTGYQNVQVRSQMSGSYQYYQNQKLQASLDGTNYTDLTSLNITTTWQNLNYTLPSDYNDKALVYIRWVANSSSTRNGNAADNDGTSLTNVFVFADPIPVVDETAPLLVSSIPAEGAATVSANGNIVLTFNEAVKVGSGSSVLGSTTLTPAFGSKSVTFPYVKLTYNTDYTFTVPAGAITDNAGNPYAGLTLNFHTMNRPTPAAKVFDAVIAADGSGNYTTVQAAIDAAPSGRAIPWLIFVKNGTYNGHVDIPATKPYINMIGQSRDSVIITAARLSGSSPDSVNVYSVDPGASVVVKAANCYFENICFENKYGYDHNSGPQALALYTTNDRVILNNCWLRSYQDTYLTTYGNVTYRHYLKNCRIEGAVDFIYGGGDVFFDQCTIYCKRASGGYIVAPSHQTGTQWGYVFSNCTIDGTNPSYTTYLGRPWANRPMTSFFNTRIKIGVYDAGWYYKMGAIPAIFADYNSVDGNGSALDLSQRISTYQIDSTKNNITTTYTYYNIKNSFTDEEAATYTYENVTSGSDSWDPRALIEPTDAPSNIKLANDGSLTWDATPYAICYAILRNNKVIAFSTTPSYTDADFNVSATYKVVAVAESGALSSAATAGLSSKATDHFRTSTSGNWSTLNLWQSSSNNSSWMNATEVPAVSATEITIADGHTLTIDANVNVPVINVNATSKITLASDKSMSVTNLNLNSNAGGTATFVNLGQANVTEATVNQYLTSGRNWYISSPVSSATAGTLLTGASKVYEYSESASNWVQLAAGASLVPGKGYITQSSVTGAVLFNGTLNDGNVQVSLQRSGLTKPGYNLVGNPYPSYLSWKACYEDLDNTANSKAGATIWYRTKNASDQYTFATYNAATNLGTTLDGTRVNGNIPPMQAFWVRVDEGNTSGTLKFKNSMRLHKGSQLQSNGLTYDDTRLKTTALQQMLALNLTDNTNTDEAIIVFNPNASNGPDNYDSYKMSNNTASIPEIFTLVGSDEMVINGLNSFKNNTIIPLGFRTGVSGQFTLNAGMIKNFDSETKIILKDNLTAAETDLTTGESYTFSAESGTTTTRFNILFKTPENTTALEDISHNRIIYTAESKIFVESTDTDIKEMNIDILNIAGQKIFSRNVTGDKQFCSKILEKGAYLVRITQGNQIVTSKIIIP